jgi:exosortase/archaeosortase family protein
MPSLQFYLGYPLRIVSGETAARLLNLAGFPAIREGALLNWRDHAVFIDAPCSGIKMLWAGMLLALALSALRGLGPGRTLGLAVVAFGAVVAGNILRTTSLFFLETGVVRGPAWAHSAVGIATFAAVAVLIAWLGGPPRRGEPAAGGIACAT